MTKLKRTTLVASLAAAGLLGAGGFAHADEADVSSIYGRASPGNPEIVARSSVRAGDRHVQEHTAATSPEAQAATVSGPAVIEAQATTNPESMTPPAAQASTAEGEYLSTPTTSAAAPGEVITPTGQYLDVGESGMVVRPEETVVIHEEPLDGEPLVAGRGVREGIDYHADTVQTVPAFDVQEVMGRSSPPAPEGAAHFGFPS